MGLKNVTSNCSEFGCERRQEQSEAAEATGSRTVQRCGADEGEAAEEALGGESRVLFLSSKEKVTIRKSLCFFFPPQIEKV